MATVITPIQHCFCFGQEARVPRARDPSLGSSVIRAYDPSLYIEADSSPDLRVSRAPRVTRDGSMAPDFRAAHKK